MLAALTVYRSIFRQHKALLWLLLIFSVLTLYNSVSLPLGEAADETDHYRYLRFVARTGHPPLTEAERAEAGFKGGLAPLYYWLSAGPIAWVGPDRPPDIRRVDGRPERYIPNDGLGFNHVLHTLDERWPWRGQTLAWHLVRLLSLPPAWVTLIATYALARRLFPQQRLIALAAVTFLLLLPRFVISSAVINDDNLVFALTSLLLLTQVAILQGNHQLHLYVLTGALFGLALITKYFSLILIPELLLTLYLGGKATPARRARALLAFAVALALTAGPWFVFIILRFNRIASLGLIPGLAAALGEPQITAGLAGLLSGQSVRPVGATYPFFEWAGLLYRSFWFEYGWMNIFAPGWVYRLLTIFVGLVLFGLTQTIRIYPNEAGGHSRQFVAPPLTGPILALLGLHLILFLCVVLARYVLSATIDTGQGRHLFPALPVFALLVAVGVGRIWSRWSHPLWRPALALLGLVTFALPAGLTLVPAQYILPHYPTHPVTVRPAAGLPVTYRQQVAVTDAFALAGFSLPAPAVAGQAWPVTLFWTANKEVNQDYLVSLCLQDTGQRPVACVRQHFGNGRYPARAWEAGDTIVDTMFIPIPACPRLPAGSFQLHLTLWPLRPDALAPQVAAEPALQQSFTGPLISIQAGPDVSSQSELWREEQRLAAPARLELNQAVTQLIYGPARLDPAAITFQAESSDQSWRPLPEFDTPLFLPCAASPQPVARAVTFIAAASLPAGVYHSPTAPPLTLATRSRALTPLTAGLSFDQTLVPLSLEIPPDAAITDLGAAPAEPDRPILPRQLPTATVPVTIRWQSQRWLAEPLVISLKLLDKDFNLAGQRVASLGDRYPNVLWAPTEVVEETYSLAISPDASPGLYRLELSLLRPAATLADGFAYLPLRQAGQLLGPNLYPVTLRLLDPAHSATPTHPFSAQIGDSINLIGFDLTRQAAQLNLALYWQATAAIPSDYTVFTQLLGPDGQVWAQWDNPPQGGRYPTTAWSAADRVVDRYTLIRREGAPGGTYRLLIGMYDPGSGERLPATIEGRPQPDNALELTTIPLGP